MIDVNRHDMIRYMYSSAISSRGRCIKNRINFTDGVVCEEKIHVS